MGTFKDLTGLKFGLLYVKGRAETQKRKTMWHVRCDCGVEKAIRGENLVQGYAKSCGCSSKKFKQTKSDKRFSLVNQRFGRLWVLWRAGSKRYGANGSSNALWECQCDCGKIVKVTAHSLRNGTKSCGCLQREIAAAPAAFPPGQAGFNIVLNRYKTHATQRNLAWELSEEDFRELISGPCFYCGESPSQTIMKYSKNGQLVYNGIDRLKNEVGYVAGNVVSCCGSHNRMKGTMTYEAFIANCLKIVKYKNALSESAART